jgi:acyl carrier protein
MNRDEILALVVGYVAEAVEGLQVADVDPTRSLRDHDLTSLDIVEVVSRSMRQLNVTLPRSQLRKMASINDLVDGLYRTVAVQRH